MRVLCIDADFTEQRSRHTWKYVQEIPSEGETYEIDEVVQYSPTHHGYILKGVNGGINPLTGKPLTFNERRFVMLQDDEELELVTEQEEETCFQI